MPGRIGDEFGDFQTPAELASAVCRFLAGKTVVPAAIVEPTCGRGNLLLAGLDTYPSARGLGFEINPAYVESARARLKARGLDSRCRVNRESFFNVRWNSLLGDLPEPVLVLGNPPWVTNSDLGAVGSLNLPPKSNFQKHTGLDALTGKSNFDISEWMILRLLEGLTGRKACLAVLCKTAVARKVLANAWKTGLALDRTEIRNIDAARFFGASVDACLLVCMVSAEKQSQECDVFPDLTATVPRGVIGWRDGHLIADLSAWERWKHLAGDSPCQWRSGVKHDCAKVMELRRSDLGYRNGLGEDAALEENCLFPMLKSSDIARGRVSSPERWMLIPQRSVGEDTSPLEARAPRTWEYLTRHAAALDARKSSIYRNRPRFSVFGVGEYTFAPWKVAISGFHKRLEFQVVGSFEGRPIVLDDTAYFLPCESETQARRIAAMLNHRIAAEFIAAYLFRDSKRPVTAELLRRLNLDALSRELDPGFWDEPASACRQGDA